MNFTLFGEKLAGMFSYPKTVDSEGIFITGNVKKATEVLSVTTADYIVDAEIPVALVKSEDVLKSIKLKSGSAVLSASVIVTDGTTEVALVGATSITASSETVVSMPINIATSSLKTLGLNGEIYVVLKVTTAATVAGDLLSEVETLSDN